MRVQNGAVDSPYSSSRSSAAQNVGVDPRAAASGASTSGADFVSLSNAASLVGLAKGKIPADKEAQFEAIRQQVQSGQYQAEASGVSQALVQGHLRE